MIEFTGNLAHTIGFAICIALLFPNSALSGNCVDEKVRNSYGTSKAKAIVENQGTVSIYAEIFRGSTLKKNAWLKKGEMLSHISKSGGGGTAQIGVGLYRDDVTNSTWCAYEVRLEGAGLLWSLPEGSDAPCASSQPLAITCEKNFNKGKLRWETTFTVWGLQTQ